MGDLSDLEQLISVRSIQEDCEAIYSLLKSENDPIFSMEIIPYYSLFVQSCQEYMGENFLSEDVALRIKDIRNQIKSYAEPFGKSKRKVASIDLEQDMSFKSQLRFDFLKSWNIHLNIGTYWTEDHHIIGNTQQLAAFLDVKDLSDPQLGKKHYELGYQIGAFVASIRNGFAESMSPPPIARAATKIEIKRYHDFIPTKRMISLLLVQQRNCTYFICICSAI